MGPDAGLYLEVNSCAAPCFSSEPVAVLADLPESSAFTWPTCSLLPAQQEPPSTPSIRLTPSVRKGSCLLALLLRI